MILVYELKDNTTKSIIFSFIKYCKNLESIDYTFVEKIKIYFIWDRLTGGFPNHTTRSP
jgi:hypothetical protein